jgi:hypothetical protein
MAPGFLPTVDSTICGPTQILLSTDGIVAAISRKRHKIGAHLLDPLCMMDRRIVHDKDRLRFWPFTTVLEKLLNKILKDGGIRRSLKYTCKNNGILCICRQNLIGVTPSGDQAVRLNPIRLSQPDSST